MINKKKLSANIVMYGLSNGIKSLVPFLILPILTAYISTEGYGILSIIETTILFVAPFILINIQGAVAIEFHKLDKNELSIYISNSILVSFLAFLLVSVIFYFLKTFISQQLDLPIELVLFLPIFAFLRLIPLLQLVLFQANQEPKKYLFFSTGQTVLDFLISFVLVVAYKYGYIGRVSGIYFSFFLFAILGISLLLKNNYLQLKFSKEKIKSFLKFGVPLIPHAIGGTIIAMSDRYFIAHFYDNASVGIYTVAYQIGALMLLFGTSVNQAWSPMMFQYLKKKQSVTKIIYALIIIFVIIGLLIYLFSDLLFGILVDENYWEAKKYFPFLLLGFIFQSIYFLFANFVFYSKRTKLLASITALGAIINLLLNYVLIKQFGVIGVAYSTAITWFIFMLLTYIAYKTKIASDL